MDSSGADRTIVLVDMDCFYVQVEQKLCPELQNKPCAVVQYKTWKGGGIIAVNYEARAKGVTRLLRGDEAQQKCPDIHLFRVPEVRGKADLTKYREAGALVLDVLCEYSDCVERASIDEAYLDMTSVISSRMKSAPPVTADQLPNTFVIGWEGENTEYRKSELEKWLQTIYEEEHLYNDRMLAITAVIVEEMRAAVYEKTGYRCSAGIAHNKMLAKLSCGIHKPDKQTVLPQSSIQLLFKTIPIKKVRNLGGKLGGTIMKKFGIEHIGDLINVPRSQFVGLFGEKTGCWLYNLVRGIENEPVISRQLPKSIGCAKNFSGKSSLATRNEVTHWLKQLATELEERLTKDQNTNKRFARLLTISVRTMDGGSFSVVSRSCSIHVYNADKLAHDALLAIGKQNTSSSDSLWRPRIYMLSMAASKFEDKLDNSHSSIQSYLVPKEGTPSAIAECEPSKAVPFRRSIVSFFAKKQMESVDNGEDQSPLECLDADPPSEATEASPECEPPKAGPSDRSIASFFTKKQMESVDNREDQSPLECLDADPPSEATEASVECELPKAGSSNRSIASFFAKKQMESANNGEDQSSPECLDPPGETTVDAREVQPPGFFARKLKECSSGATHEAKSLDNESPNESDSCSGLDPELTKVCDQCQKRIPVWEETEHFDYHVALKLSNEWKGPGSSVRAPSGKSSGAKRRKRGSAAHSAPRAKKPFVQNTLDAFIL